MKTNFTQAELNMRAKAYHDNHFNHVHHSYIDITGDLVTGTLLSRIVFWFSPNKEGKSKLRVFKDGHYWLAKNRTDWWDEIRITPKQYDRAIKILQQKNLIVKKIYKFDKDPTTHIRLNYEQLEIEVNKWLKDVKQMIVDGEIDKKGRKTNFPKGKKPDVSRDKVDYPEENAPNKEAEPQENQGEAPNPLGNLVFPQKGKTNSPDGEEGNSLLGENEFDQTGKSLTGNTNRKDIQGELTERTIQQQENDMDVVVVKELIQALFNQQYSNEMIKKLIELSKIHNRDLEEAIHKSVEVIVAKQEAGEKLTNPYGIIVWELKNSWDLSAITAKSMKSQRYTENRDINFEPYDWTASQD
ncbi:hypothetical protein [Desmospora activa]|uniref:Uncharacterized protein n=1 Tax=Desmospora activa DSM 45169 TaxID=1121389 RepID=A0A2T4YYZ4_9BACL|nr:hypothetical protein [Desmospora activa]PTM52196.1 hypothetical protein C8J48_3743 [Desmospora activa DSM 45169]